MFDAPIALPTGAADLRDAEMIDGGRGSRRQFDAV